LRCAGEFALGRRPAGEAAAASCLPAADLSEADILPILPVLLQHQASGLAARLLETVAGRGGASVPTLARLAELQENAGRYREARATLEKSPERQQPSAALLSQLARLAYRAGDLEGALGYLAHARDLEPANPAIHFFFGIVCVELKLPPEARQSLREAVRLDPDNPYYNYALGAVLVNEKNPDGAIPHFKKFREALPGDPRGRFALGVAYYDAYQLEAARAELTAVADRPETRLGAQLYLGRLAIREDHLDEALEHLRLAIQANPSAPEAYAESGLAHIRRKEYALAGKDLDRAIRLAPDHYLSNQRLLMLYRRTNDPRAAAQAERVEKLQQAGEEKERLLLRSLEIRPYSP
jgi:tetratricopeptide (TPR) repeat protein